MCREKLGRNELIKKAALSTLDSATEKISTIFNNYIDRYSRVHEIEVPEFYYEDLTEEEIAFVDSLVFKCDSCGWVYETFNCYYIHQGERICPFCREEHETNQYIRYTPDEDDGYNPIYDDIF